MGKTGSKVKMMRDQASPGNPDLKSLISGSLAEFADWDTFWDCLLDVLTSDEHSFLDINREGKIKESQVMHGSSSEIIVTRVINGMKFDVELANELGLNRQLIIDEKELKRFTAGEWQLMERYNINKEKGELFVEKYATDPYRMLNMSFMVLHKEPLVFEYWLETLRPRLNIDLLKWGIERELDHIAGLLFWDSDYMRVMYAAKRARPRGLIQWVEQSPSDPAWDAFVSLELDDLFTYDALFDALVNINMRPPWFDTVLVDEMGPNQWKIEVPPTLETDARGHLRKTSQKKVSELTVDKAKGKMRNLKYDPWGGVKNVDTHVLHRNPLRLEVWSEVPRRRRSGRLVQPTAQVLLDAIIDRIETLRGCMEQVDQEFYENPPDCPPDGGSEGVGSLH